MVIAIAIDGRGHKWFAFGENGGGVTEFDGAHWTNYSMADGMADNYVRAAGVDRQGQVWFGHGLHVGRGLSVFDGTGWTTYSSADGLSDNYIRAITLDRAGHLWFGTMGGVSEYILHLRVYLPLVVRDQ